MSDAFYVGVLMPVGNKEADFGPHVRLREKFFKFLTLHRMVDIVIWESHL